MELALLSKLVVSGTIPIRVSVVWLALNNSGSPQPEKAKMRVGRTESALMLVNMAASYLFLTNSEHPDPDCSVSHCLFEIEF